MKRFWGILAFVAVFCLFCVCLADKAPYITSFKSENGQSVDLSKAAELRVNVNRCEYGEPTQVIRDGETVRRAADAMGAITVEGLRDTLSSTATYYEFVFYDANGASLFAASFQDGLLMENDGRYDVSGLETLLGIDGVMLANDWDEYWEKADEIESEYLENLNVVYPASIFDVRGYESSRIQAEDVTGVEVYVSRNDEAGRLNTDDPETILRVFDALKGVKATGEAPEDGEGLTYFVTLRYTEEYTNIARSVWFRFEGNRLECGDKTYEVSNLDSLFGIEGVNVLSYLREHYMD